MNTTAQEQIDAYVDAVRDALAELPEAARRELLEDLPEHLAEVLAEGDGPLAERLGPPELYAAELRAASGSTGGASDPLRPVDRVARFRARVIADARRHLETADVSIGPLFGHARAGEFLLMLRPAWWVLRGYLVAMVLAHLLDDSGQPIGLLPRIGGSEPVALLLLAAGVMASVWLGRRTAALTSWPRYAVRAGTVLLALVAVNLFIDADQSSRGSIYQDTGYSSYPGPFSGVEDILVYDKQGRPLTGVHLFDQNGVPIHLGSADLGCPAAPGILDEDPTGGWELTYPHCRRTVPFPERRLWDRPPVPNRPTAPQSSESAQPPATPTPEPTDSARPVPGRSGSDRPTPASPTVTAS